MCLEDNIQSNFRIPYIPPPQQPLFMASTTSWQTLCIYVKSHFMQIIQCYTCGSTNLLLIFISCVWKMLPS